MNLLKFRVKDFRSIIDTDWIDCQQITSFVGTNGSGKTSLFMALMKIMNPNHEFRSGTTLKSNIGALARIVLKFDLPIDRVDELLPVVNETVFVETVFGADDELNQKLTEFNPRFKPVETIYISKTYSGVYKMDIFNQFREADHEKVTEIVLSRLPVFLYYREVTEFKSSVNLVALAYKIAGYKNKKSLTMRESIFANLLTYLDIWQTNLVKSIGQVYGDWSDETVQKSIDFMKVFDAIPMFKERFDRGFAALNDEFKKWWGDDELTIAYEVFKRGIKIKILDKDGKVYLLENRSTGFRRFFAIFLAFSVTARSEFENTILLFDEAGAALHPITQRKLAKFFNELGKNTQIMYNTHTSYMLPIEEMNRSRIVYTDETGHTRVNCEYYMTKDRTNEESLFAVQAALAMHLASSTLVGAYPIVVVNDYDMIYLQVIKNILIAQGKLNTIYEALIFSGGANGIDTNAEIFSANSELPVILLASDEKSREIKTRLLADTYKNNPDKVFEISNFMEEVVNFEDLIPASFVELFMSKYLAKLLGSKFKYNSSKPLISQIEDFAKDNNIKLSPSYRMDIARNMKICVMNTYTDQKTPGNYSGAWLKIMRTLLQH